MPNLSNSDKMNMEKLIYLRIIAAASMRIVAEKIINTYRKAIVYKNLNGKNSHEQVSKITKVPRRTVSSYIEEFVSLGLVVRASELSKYDKALFTLEELQIDIDFMKNSEKKLKKGELSD